ncbi:MAG: glycosyl transferase, partial [Pseudomonadota bacterium]
GCGTCFVTAKMQYKPKPKVSIVVPTCREGEASCVKDMTQSYSKSNDIERLIVDSESSDEQIELWRENGWQVETLDGSNRAQRLQRGYDLSTGELVVFHHPRSLLPPEAIEWLLSNWQQVNWGGFTHKFDISHPLLRFTSFYSNRVRPKISRVVYLDHCIYFRREYLDQQIPDMPIFEDTEISSILAKHAPPVILPFVSQTSAVRFVKNGVVFQALLNQKAKVEYLLGRDPKSMNRGYEQGLNLNE